MDLNLLKEQQEYYNKRANEYDQWWLRQGLTVQCSNSENNLYLTL